MNGEVVERCEEFFVATTVDRDGENVVMVPDTRSAMLVAALAGPSHMLPVLLELAPFMAWTQGLVISLYRFHGRTEIVEWSALEERPRPWTFDECLLMARVEGGREVIKCVTYLALSEQRIIATPIFSSDVHHLLDLLQEVPLPLPLEAVKPHCFRLTQKSLLQTWAPGSAKKGSQNHG